MRFFKPPTLITRLFPQVLWSIPNEDNQAFLSFDDGPDQRFTPKILTILRQENIAATFFVIGSNAEKNPSLVKRVAEQGHKIGIHSYHHQRLILHSRGFLCHEILSSKRLVEQVTGQEVKLFRPPYGLFSPQLIKVCEQCNLKMVNWSYLTYDFDLHLTDHFFLNYAEQSITSGDIIVLHDGHRHSFRTVAMLPFFISRLKNKGMKFALIS